MKKLMNTAIVACLSATSLSSLGQSSGWLQTGAGPYSYTNTANWVDGTVNGIWNSDLTLTAHQTATFDADAIIPSLTFNYAGDYNVTLRSDGAANRTLTLGGDIAVAPVKSRTITIGSTTANNGLNIDLGGATRTLNVNAGRTLVLLNVVTNGGLAITGGGVVTLNGANVFADGVSLKDGKVRMQNASALGTGTFNIGDTVGTTAVILESNTANLVNSQNNPQNWNQDFAFSNTQNLNLGTGVVTLAGSRAINVTGWTLTVGGAIGGGPYSITKNGTGNLVFNGANTYSGGTVINAGRMQFGPGAVPSTGSILINIAGTLNTGSAYPTIQGLLDSGRIDKTSSGTLALTGDSSESVDFSASGYPNLMLGASSASTFTGTLTPYNGVYRLGGGGSALTFSSANTLTGSNRLVVGAAGSTSGTPTFTAPQNFTGTTTIESQTLELSGADGAFTASPIIVNQDATLRFTAPTSAGGTIRATNVTLRSGTLRVTGNSGADSIEVVDGDIIVEPNPKGGVSVVRLDAVSTRNAKLTAQSLIRREGAILTLYDQNIGGAPGPNMANFTLVTPPELVGAGGVPGSTTNSIVPWAIAGMDSESTYDDTFVTYDAVNGLRPLDLNAEFLSAANVPQGTVTQHNVLVPHTTTWEVATNTTINSLVTGGGQASTDTQVTGTGTLSVASGLVLVGYSRYSTPVISAPLAFGTQAGKFMYASGKGSTLRSTISGTGGLVFFQNRTSGTDSGLTVSSDASSSTYTGNTYVLGRVTLPSGFLPNGTRSGNVHVYGRLLINSGTINGLYGSGQLNKPNSGGGILQIGDNDEDGDFDGSIDDFGALSITKIGAGAQRLAGSCTYDGATSVSGGTLIADGSFTSAFTVQTNAILRGNGTINKSGTTITVKNGGKLAPGDSTGIGTMTVLQGGVAFENGAAMEVTVDKDGQGALAVAGDVTGEATIPVTVNGDGIGKWKIMEAASIAPDFVSATSGVVLTLEADGTQLWAERLNPATVLVIR